MTDEDFIPYLILVRFDKDADLRDRLEESLPLLRSALAELGSVEPVTSSYAGSAVTFFLASRAEFQPDQIVAHLISPRSRKPSPLRTHDKALVIAMQCGAALKLERADAWLREYGLLGE